MNQNQPRFWVPEPSALVTSDFKRLFDAHAVDLDLFMMGSQGNVVMLMKSTLDQVKEWSDLEFKGRWKFRTAKESNELQVEKDGPNGSETQCEVDNSKYSLRYTLLSAQILGGEVSLYIWPNRNFRPMILMSDTQERCGAIAVPNCQSDQSTPRVIRLKDVASRTDSSSQCNLLPLTSEQMKQIEKDLRLEVDLGVTSPYNVPQDYPLPDQVSPTNDTKEDSTSPPYSRKCGNDQCNATFYCLGECKTENRLSIPNSCYCPQCARKHGTTAPEEKGYCQTRFPEQTTSGTEPRPVTLDPILIKALEKSLGL